MLNFYQMKIGLFICALIYAYVFGCYFIQNILILLTMCFINKKRYTIPFYLCVLVRTTLVIQEVTLTDSFFISLINVFTSKDYENLFTNTFVKLRRRKYLKKVDLNELSQKSLSVKNLKEDKFELLVDLIESFNFYIFKK